MGATNGTDQLSNSSGYWGSGTLQSTDPAGGPQNTYQPAGAGVSWDPAGGPPNQSAAANKSGGQQTTPMASWQPPAQQQPAAANKSGSGGSGTGTSLY
jgi:hypothetical protein